MQVFNLVSFPILKIKLFIKMFPGLLLASTFVPFGRHKFAVHTELYKISVTYIHQIQHTEEKTFSMNCKL